MNIIRPHEPSGKPTHQSVIQELNGLIRVNRLPKSLCVNISQAPRNLFPVPGKKNLEQDSIVWQIPQRPGGSRSSQGTSPDAPDQMFNGWKRCFPARNQWIARGDKAWKGREPVPGVRRTISRIKPVMIGPDLLTRLRTHDVGGPAKPGQTHNPGPNPER